MLYFNPFSTGLQSVLNVHDQIANKDYPVRPIPIDEHIGASRFETVRIDKKRNPLVRISN